MPTLRSKFHHNTDLFDRLKGPIGRNTKIGPNVPSLPSKRLIDGLPELLSVEIFFEVTPNSSAATVA